MNLTNRINAFIKLGNTLNDLSENPNSQIFSLAAKNPWYNEKFMKYALVSIAENLSEKNLLYWVNKEQKFFPDNNSSPKNIAVIMAGNIPLVGFHDFISVLMSANIFTGKLSSDDKYLLPAIADILIEIEPEFKKYIYFSENKIQNFDAIIATGSNNTFNYFNYYFGKYPNILRKNRNSLAFISNNESSDNLSKLADDIFLYFGLGCRNVSKIFLPQNFDFNLFINAFKNYDFLLNHHKYYNIYKYYKSIFLLNAFQFYDLEFSLIKKDDSLFSPVSVLNYQHYSNKQDVIDFINNNNSDIQCVISSEEISAQQIFFGNSQKPQLWEYADNINVPEFLFHLKK